jgi:hypothetical protein
VKRLLRWIAVALGALAALLAVTLAILHEQRPVGRTSPDADTLAARMQAAVAIDRWRETGAVWWTYDRRETLLWDRRRGFARVRWKNLEVLLDTMRRSGTAQRDGVELSPDDARPLIDRAYRRWVNDSFWLNPFATLFDEGVERSIVEVDGGEGLLVSYGSGGVTPGDAYLWKVDRDGLPTAWKMWVSLIPIGGLETTWERWIVLATGARIATLHRGLIGPRIEDVIGAPEVLSIEADDPFTNLASSSR